MMRRPTSLAEVAAWATDRRAFHLHLADFIDEFRRFGDGAMLTDEPRRLDPVYEGGEVADAYLAAVAVSLAREIHESPPAWAWDEDRKLRVPWFAWPGPALRATLLAESPAPFRERNLFVSANALARA
jgi:hypothetical protein